jgi:hypothetical protein
MTDSPSDFRLAEGEMIYDLNGFNYQTYLYNEEGVPASFGEQLGGFTDVIGVQLSSRHVCQ